MIGSFAFEFNTPLAIVRCGSYRVWQAVVAVLALACPASGQIAAQQVDDSIKAPHQQVRFFEEQIHPVLVAKCYECHSRQAAEVEGGLWLDSPAGMRQGGDSGPSVVPGNEASSLLLAAISSKDNHMPPDAPLAPEEIEDFRKWILSGAVDPRQVPDESALREPDFREARQFWSFQPVENPALPPIRNRRWPTSPIDHFILQKLEQQKLSPAPPASAETLVRRLYLDLIGLPPTPDEVDAFVRDPSDEAYRQLVDHLLESPHYGERAAQHWLDVVRYAETEGFEYDRSMPDAWRYRDYVIASFNDDKPYDRFLLEQLAGDELDSDDAELRIAAGFHRLGAVRRNAGNQKVASSRNEVLTERTDIVGSAILGLTVGCARCHDHKFDPIPQQDYYRLQAFFAATQEDNVPLQADDEQRLRQLARSEELEAKIGELKEIIAGLNGDEETRVREQIEQLEAQIPAPGPTICSICNDFESLAPVYLLKRGNPELQGRLVGMRTPGVLLDAAQPELPATTTNPRTQLARELLDPGHPLTARVFVNRIWQQHFGVGLVSTPNDFGMNGSPPSHPELLDYLAHEFVSQGWQVKALHRLVVNSSVYRQASGARDVARTHQIDPANRLLGHFPRRRLSGEEIRDAMLSVSGRLSPRMGGESVILPVEQELVDQLYKPSQWQVSEQPEEHLRRSIYLLAKRNLRLPFMEVFDQPSAQTSCASREQSTHARQALELLNGPIANELAAALAERLTREVGRQPEAVVQRAYQLAAGRHAMPAEQAISQQFLEEVGLNEFALAMFNLNAFLYVD